MHKEDLTPAGARPTRKDYITMLRLNLALRWIAQGVALYL